MLKLLELHARYACGCGCVCVGEEACNDSNKFRDLGNWTNLALKGLSNQILEADYAKYEQVNDVHLTVNMLSDKLETMHTDLNEGFRIRLEKIEQDSNTITKNDVNIGGRINDLKEVTKRVAEKIESISQAQEINLTNDEILNKNFQKIRKKHLAEK